MEGSTSSTLGQRRYLRLEEEDEEEFATEPHIASFDLESNLSPSSTTADAVSESDADFSEFLEEAVLRAAAEANGAGTTGGSNDAQQQQEIPEVLDPRYSRRALLGTWKKANLVLVCYLIPTTISLGVVTGVDWSSPCEVNLRLWSLVQMSIHVLVLIASLFVLLGLPKATATDDQLEAAYKRLRPVYLLSRCVDLFWFVWFVVGMVWIFGVSAKQCPSTAPHLYNMSLVLMLVQTVLLTLGMMFCCCSCCLLSLQAVLGPAIASQLASAAPSGATKKMINNLKMQTYSDKLGIDADHSSCAICLSDYEKGQELRFLPCNHHFHAECVDRWLKTNKSCPFCKRCIDKPPIVTNV
jgi:hypothetical protein